MWCHKNIWHEMYKNCNWRKNNQLGELQQYKASVNCKTIQKQVQKFISQWTYVFFIYSQQLINSKVLDGCSMESVAIDQLSCSWLSYPLFHFGENLLFILHLLSRMFLPSSSIAKVHYKGRMRGLVRLIYILLLVPPCGVGQWGSSYP